MRLRRLEVEHFRGIAGPLVIDFHERLTVVAGPNESGKSTLREALRMALLEKHSSNRGKAVQPWESTLSPRVTLAFDMGGDGWEVNKEFLRRKDAAQLRKNGRIVAEDAQVQPELDRLLGDYEEWLATLWGLQGQVTLSVPDTLKGRLAAASEATVSPGITWLEEHLATDYGKYWTEKTGRPKAALAEARDKTIKAEAALLQVEQALTEADQREALVAQGLARLDQLREHHQAQGQGLQDIEARLKAWDAWRHASAELKRRQEAKSSVERWLKVWHEATGLLAGEVADPGEAPGREPIESLSTLQTWLQLSIQLDLQAEADRLPVVTAKDLADLRALDQSLKSIDAALAMGLMSVSVDAERRLEIGVDTDGEHQDSTVDAGQSETWTAAATAVLSIPGVGQVRVSSGNAQAQEQIQNRLRYQKDMATLLKRLRVPSLDEALSVMQQRQVLEARLGGVAPDRPRWEALRATVGDVADPQARLDGLPAEMAEAEAAWKAANEAHARAQARHRAQAGARQAQQTLWDTAVSVEGPTSFGDVRPWEALVAQLEAECRALEATLVRPPGEEISPAVLEAERALHESQAADIQGLDRELQQAIGILKGQGDLFSRRVAAQEDLARAEAQQRRIELQADAVKLLWQTFQAARDKLRAEVAAPLSSLVAARLGQLTQARYRDVHFDRDLRIDSVVPQQVSKAAVSDLSFGTQEQLLLLTRLCLAEMLAANGSPQVVLLDDNLVHTDQARMGQACRLLVDSSTRVQVVIFTCHPERYAFPGAALSTCELS